MKIVLLQTDIQWAHPQVNIQRAEMLMKQKPAADLYVLPEMWATGFAVEPEGIAEEEHSSSALTWMRQTAKVHQCAISGSLAVRVEDGSYRNRHYFITPKSEVFYDKHHLFTHGHEHEAYQSGQEHVIAEYGNMRFLLLTCYDLRFPVWARYGWAGHYDAIIYAANWPAKRQTAWEVLVRARAIENQCYVVAVNRVGDDPVSHYEGGSMVVDPVGTLLARTQKETEQPLLAELSLDTLHKRRDHFRALDDRDVCVNRNVYPMV